jgi:hypothetical protein
VKQSRYRVVALCCLVLALFAPVTQAAPITNGSFETGDFSGWSTSGNTAVVTSYAGFGPTFSPTNGTFFAIAAGGQEGVYQTFSQSFTAQAGDQLTFDVFFQANDLLTHNDDGYANLLDGSSMLVATLFSSSVGAVGDFGDTGWVSVSYTFTSGGTFTLEFGVRNALDSNLSSVIGADNVNLLSAPIPEPATMAIFGVCAAAAGVYGYRRRQQAA